MGKQCHFCGNRDNSEEIHKLQKELYVTDEILKERIRVLDAIPECPTHGAGCVPHAIEWVRSMQREKKPKTILPCINKICLYCKNWDYRPAIGDLFGDDIFRKCKQAASLDNFVCFSASERGKCEGNTTTHDFNCQRWEER